MLRHLSVASVSRVTPATRGTALQHPARHGLLGAAATAQAALDCNYSRTDVDMFAGQYGGFFGFDDDFATVAIGDRVGPMREVNLVFGCNITRTTSTFGVGRKAVPGIIHDIATDTWTTPQLRARGLGYQIWWHQMGDHNNHWYPVDMNPDLDQDATPYQWVDSGQYTTNGFFQLLVPVRVIFFKINDNFRNTNGVYVADAIRTELFRFYVAERERPATPAGGAYAYTLNLRTFSSNKRVCTPLVERVIRFPDLSVEQLPAAGKVEASTRTFSLTFNCPYMAWYTLGFRLEGVYQQHEIPDSGVFGIKQGQGYAQGLGIQIEAENLASDWTGDMNSTSPWQVLKAGTDYLIPWFEYSIQSRNQNPATASRTRSVNFRASYYRLPGAAVTGGKVESAVLIHFVYK